MTENNPKPYSVRIPPALREKLETSAKNNGRSLHADLLLRLEESFKLVSIDGLPTGELLRNIDLSTPKNRKILKAAIKEVIREEREDNQANN